MYSCSLILQWAILFVPMSPYGPKKQQEENLRPLKAWIQNSHNFISTTFLIVSMPTEIEEWLYHLLRWDTNHCDNICNLTFCPLTTTTYKPPTSKICFFLYQDPKSLIRLWHQAWNPGPCDLNWIQMQLCLFFIQIYMNLKKKKSASHAPKYDADTRKDNFNWHCITFYWI